MNRFPEGDRVITDRSGYTLQYVKDCDCKASGCKADTPRLDTKEENGRIYIAFVFSPYTCPVCAKPWKREKYVHEEQA